MHHRSRKKGPCRKDLFVRARGAAACLVLPDPPRTTTLRTPAGTNSQLWLECSSSWTSFKLQQLVQELRFRASRVHAGASVKKVYGQAGVDTHDSRVEGTSTRAQACLKNTAADTSRQPRGGRREEGKFERSVEAIEQPIAVPASWHFGLLERLCLVHDSRCQGQRARHLRESVQYRLGRARCVACSAQWLAVSIRTSSTDFVTRTSLQLLRAST